MPPPLTQKIVNQTIAAGKPCEIGDGRARGLVLRVFGPGSWTWNIRRYAAGSDYRFRLGDGWSLEEARGIALQFELMVQRGEPPWSYGRRVWDVFLVRRRAEKEGAKLDDNPDQSLTPHQPSLPFKLYIEPFIAEIARTLRQTTADGYRWSLNVAELKPFHNSLVKDITRQDMAGVLKAIANRGVERQAELVAAALRRFWKWLGSDAMVAKTSVEPGVVDTLRAPERTLVEDGDGDGDGENALRVPGADDVARIVKWLQNPDSPAIERDRLAGLLLVYSVQRRRAVALARKAEFEPAGEHGGLWKIPALHRKSASVRARRGLEVGAHVVPLPPSAWAVVKAAMALAGESEWLFPAVRARRASRAQTTMHPAALTHLFADIAGNDCSPHDVRRAFATTYAKAADLEMPSIKRILDHSEGVVSGDVTKEHYMFLSGEHKKWPTMRGWAEWVDAAASRGPV